MGGILARLGRGLRDGTWVAPRRIRVYGLMFIVAFAIALIELVATANGINDRLGRPIGTDFSNIYAAGTYAIEGDGLSPFDPERQFTREKTIFGPKTMFFGWHYPPFFLLLAGALAMLPYLLALFVWQAATLALYVTAMRKVLPRAEVIVPALAFPAVFINLAHGHNGFLTAALFAGALLLLDRRPIFAGIMIGLLAYKPQFGVLIPLVLVATGRWPVAAAATATVLALSAIVTVVFSVDVWHAFLASTEFSRKVVLEAGSTGWHKIQSVFSVARMWGGSISLSYAAQGTVTLLLAGAVIWLWRSQAAHALKAAALLIAALLATPYSLDYDLVVMAPAIAFFVAHGLAQGFRPWEKSLLAFAWATPVAARTVAMHTFVPISVLAMLALMLLILHRAVHDLALARNSPNHAVPAASY